MRPFKLEFNNKVEIFNEACVLLCSHSFLALLNTAMPYERVIMVGWFFIGSTTLNIVGNVAISTY